MHSQLLQALGYDSSPSFVLAEDAAAFGASPYSHLCRRARNDLELQGVYFLGGGSSATSPTPVVAVCRVDSEERAREIHRLLWNQDFVPFLLVESPLCVRLYSGFGYAGAGGQADQGDLDSDAIKVLKRFNQIREELDGFHSRQIDDGTLWAKWGQHVDPSKRVDWRLLASLGHLADELRRMGLPKTISHGFIGRYVYLRYLKDRGFLSDRKLEKWGLSEDQIFSRHATLEAFRRLNTRLDDETEGLNGSIFPFPAEAIRPEHLTLVAGAFRGDDPRGQLALFDAYDFSYLPIETLSVIYEQFLHEPDESTKGKVPAEKISSSGRAEGAYYTPIPLVNFLLAEMDARRKLEPGMKVLDPSCGSGAFLVQAYRLLVERAIRANGGRALPPSELTSILASQIFGVDRDRDACRIAEMSLLITLLDYVDPPDLEGPYKSFRLPKLAKKNIFEADFFDPSSDWAQKLSHESCPAFDWVIGNPPWKELRKTPKDPRDQLALDWMLAKEAPPTGGNQLSEAFVWKAGNLLKEGGSAGMVLPAMTLFKEESTGFRQAFFARFDVWCVVNFANLAYVLFSGRSNVPAMTLFFGKPGLDTKKDSSILTYAPLVIHQEANRPQAGSQLDTWNVIVNADDLREISKADATQGHALTWKLAMWGSKRDEKLLRNIDGRLLSLGTFLEEHELLVGEGAQLKTVVSASASGMVPLPELEGKFELDLRLLKHRGKMISIPAKALKPIVASRCWARKRGGLAGLSLSEPPHILIDEARRFALFSNDFLMIPARQIGLAARRADQENLLRALALFLNSDFAIYHQFFETSQWGIQRSISTLSTLRKLPVPELAQHSAQWSTFHRELVRRTFPGEAISEEDQRNINQLVYDALGLRPAERYLIEDFVRINLLMVKGKVEKEAIRAPLDDEILVYLDTLRDQLDTFMQDASAPAGHHLVALCDRRTAMLEIVLRPGGPVPPRIQHADEDISATLNETRERLLQQHRQWIYVNRNLRIYHQGRLYLFKPLQRIHWTRRQAILDAGELIAEALGTGSH